MVTHATRGRELFPIRQSLFENRVPANGIWEESGFQLQQRYDKSKRPVPGRTPLQRRQKNYGIPERNIIPIPIPKQETLSKSGANECFAVYPFVPQGHW